MQTIPPARYDEAASDDWLQLALPRDVLERLLRERALVAGELRCLDARSAEGTRHALLSTLRPPRYYL